MVYDPALAERLGGVAIAEDEQRRILAALGFVAATAIGPSLSRAGAPMSTVRPTWSRKSSASTGSTRSPSVALPRTDGVARPTATPAQKLERKLRRAAAARGLNEAVTWTFLPEGEADHFADGNGGLWCLENPISEDMKAMRPSLLPGLLSAAKRNLDRGASELAAVRDRTALSARRRRHERRTPQPCACCWSARKTPRGWAAGKAAQFDAFDAKAEALALLAEAGAPVDNLQVMGEAGPQFHPGQSATLRLGPKTVLARFGMLHPATLKAFDIDAPVAAVELFLDAIPAKKGAATFARPAYAPPALQAVTRDFAFLVPVELAAGDLVRTVKGADKANVVAVRLFDDFRGQGVPEGQKSLARRGHAPAGREELRRGRAQGDCRADYGCGGEAGCGAEGLIDGVLVSFDRLSGACNAAGLLAAAQTRCLVRTWVCGFVSCSDRGFEFLGHE